METAPSIDVAGTFAARANNTSAEVHPSLAAADSAAALNVDGQTAPAGSSQGAGGVSPVAAASAAADAMSDAQSAMAAAAVGDGAALEASGSAAQEEGRGDVAAPTLPPALQPASSEEVAVALLDSIVGGELGKLDPVSLDTVPPQVSSQRSLHINKSCARAYRISSSSSSARVFWTWLALLIHTRKLSPPHAWTASSLCTF